MSFNPSAELKHFAVVAGHNFRETLDVEREVDVTYNPGGHTLALTVTERGLDAALITPLPQLTVLSSVVAQRGAKYFLTLSAMLHLTPAQIASLAVNGLYDYVVTMTDSSNETSAVAFGYLLVSKVG